MTIELYILLAVAGSTILWLIRRQKTLKTQLTDSKADYSKLLSQKKSSEIVLGQVSEKLVPFLDVFKHDPQEASFIGQPIDYIIFGKNKITFIEVKSGNSKLTSKQRKIRDLIKNKKVEWEQINVKPD
jgi:predicted Holliday junction resolvase-like endonuclease